MHDCFQRSVISTGSRAFPDLAYFCKPDLRAQFDHGATTTYCYVVAQWFDDTQLILIISLPFNENEIVILVTSNHRIHCAFLSWKWRPLPHHSVWLEPFHTCQTVDEVFVMMSIIFAFSQICFFHALSYETSRDLVMEKLDQIN